MIVSLFYDLEDYRYPPFILTLWQTCDSPNLLYEFYPIHRRHTLRIVVEAFDHRAEVAVASLCRAHDHLLACEPVIAGVTRNHPKDLPRLIGEHQTRRGVRAEVALLHDEALADETALLGGTAGERLYGGLVLLLGGGVAITLTGTRGGIPLWARLLFRLRGGLLRAARRSPQGVAGGLVRQLALEPALLWVDAARVFAPPSAPVPVDLREWVTFAHARERGGLVFVDVPRHEEESA